MADSLSSDVPRWQYQDLQRTWCLALPQWEIFLLAECYDKRIKALRHNIIHKRHVIPAVAGWATR
ncbi:MAG: hypothetical protein ACYYK0_06615 [Candidatus Eutrophobiaceae bacterium]